MLDRRNLLKTIAATGIGTALFQRSAAAAISAADELSVDSIKQAEWITGLELTDEQRVDILETVKRSGNSLDELRKFKLSADVPMAIQFSPTSHFRQLDSVQREATPIEALVIQLPNTEEEIAFLPVSRLSWLIRTQKISSVELTNIYLRRLKKYGPMLRSVVTLTEELALEQAQRADAEISAGRYRGPLHGIPWGAKDLIAIKGYPTTWGIPYLKDRELENTATVASRLEEAGAVLVAKLSFGRLGSRGPVVWRNDAMPVEPKDRLQWLIRRFGLIGCRGSGWFYFGLGNTWQHPLSFNSKRRLRPPPNVRPG